MGVNRKRLINMKTIYLLTMLVFINVCVADKKQQEWETIQYESYDEQYADLEAERMMKGLCTIQESIEAFSKFLGIEFTNSASRFFQLSRKVDTLLKELKENVNTDIFQVFRVKNWRIEFDNIRTNFHHLTTIDWDPEKIVKIHSLHRLLPLKTFPFAKKDLNLGKNLGKRDINLKQLKEGFASIMKKYRPQMSELAKLKGSVEEVPVNVDHSNEGKEQMRQRFASSVWKKSKLLSMKPDQKADSDKFENVPSRKFSPKQIDVPVKRVPKFVQKTPTFKSSDETSSTLIFLKPIYIRNRNEWTYVNTGKKLTFEDVNTSEDWYTLLGGISLLQQSIQTIKMLDEDEDLNADINFLKNYGSLLISALQQEQISNNSCNSDRVKSIMTCYHSVLACFDTVILTHEKVLRLYYHSVTKIQLSFPISFWPNLDPLEPIYASTKEELAFVNSGKNLVFDEIKELKDTSLFIGGLMLLQESVKQIDRLGASNLVNRNIQTTRKHLMRTIVLLKDLLSQGYERNNEYVEALKKNFGNDFNKYIEILERINTSTYMDTINSFC